MVVWSTLRPLLSGSTSKVLLNAVAKRVMSGGHDHRVLPYRPSRWQWTKFKDLIHFYVMAALIPVGAVITYSNVFIGPATLSEIPDGYEPKYWEYYRHPITRFIAKNILSSPQQNYEKYLHYIFQEEEKRRIRKLESEVRNKMAERNDYQAYYYRPITGKYHRYTKARTDEYESLKVEGLEAYED